MDAGHPEHAGVNYTPEEMSGAHETDFDVRLAIIHDMLKDPSSGLSIDEAVRIASVLHRMLESLEDYRLKIKWALGMVLSHADTPFGNRRATIDAISARLYSELGIRAGKSYLYECMKLYSVFGGEYARYQEWIAEKKRALSRPVYWIDVQDHCLGGRSNPAVIGIDLANERDLFEAEKGADALHRLLERSGDEKEVEGLVEGILQNVPSGHGRASRGINRTTIPRSPEYVRFVRRFACSVCAGPAEAHHAIGVKGTGAKASDFGAVPLCRRHHASFHRMGRAEFERRHDVSLLEVAFNLMHKYVTNTWATLQLAEI